MDIKSQRDRFMAFSFASADLLLETDAAGRIGFVLGATSALGAPQSSALVGRSLTDLFAVADRSLVAHLVASVRPGRRFGPAPVRTDFGAKPALLSACTLPGREGVRFFTLAYGLPVTPAAADAPREAGTGLVSAESFEDVAADTLARMRSSGRDVRMTMISVDGQDAFIDRLGEGVGEAFLGRVGAILRAASVGDAAAQVADGRYSLIHDASQDPTDVERDLVAAALEIDPDGEGVVIAAQTVAVSNDLSGQDAARALVYAVNAFAEGRGEAFAGGASSDVFEQMMKDTSARIVEFKRAIAEKRVAFVAQPIVVLDTGAVSHYEMLVRFEEGRSPYEMVTFAEKTGVIVDLDFAVLEVAVSFLARSAPRNFPGLAVNVSGHSIVNPLFLTRMQRLLLDPGFERSRLVFEVTESAEITDLDAADVTIQKIRKLGHKVCLDDFGAGAASLPYLRKLDVDAVKIDGAYVREALGRRRDAMLLKAIASLCRDLCVTTVAEMVETQEHVDHLRRLGVDKGQGYIFGKPQPLASLAATAKAA